MPLSRGASRAQRCPLSPAPAADDIDAARSSAGIRRAEVAKKLKVVAVSHGLQHPGGGVPQIAILYVKPLDNFVQQVYKIVARFHNNKPVMPQAPCRPGAYSRGERLGSVALPEGGVPWLVGI